MIWIQTNNLRVVGCQINESHYVGNFIFNINDIIRWFVKYTVRLRIILFISDHFDIWLFHWKASSEVSLSIFS